MAKNSNKTKQKPFTPKAGFTKNDRKRRYGCGGKISTKK